jgi:hypothetical protein
MLVPILPAGQAARLSVLELAQKAVLELATLFLFHNAEIIAMGLKNPSDWKVEA